MRPHAVKALAKIADDLQHNMGDRASSVRRSGRRILEILEQEGLLPIKENKPEEPWNPPM